MLLSNNNRKSYVKGLVRTVFDSTPEKTFNPTKQYYASIFMMALVNL